TGYGRKPNVPRQINRLAGRLLERMHPLLATPDPLRDLLLIAVEPDREIDVSDKPTPFLPEHEARAGDAKCDDRLCAVGSGKHDRLMIELRTIVPCGHTPILILSVLLPAPFRR